MSEHWSQVPESGSVFGMRLLWIVHRLCGRRVLTVCMLPVVLYYYCFNRKARRSSLQFRQRLRSVGEKCTQRLWVFRHIWSFAQTMVDKLLVWTGSVEIKEANVYGRELFIDMVKQGKGGVIITSHLGNFEICQALADMSGNIKLNVLVHTKHATKFNHLLEKRSNNKIKMLQVSEMTTDVACMLSDKIEAGEILAIAGDRTPITSGRQVGVDFLGQEALLPQGPYFIAAIMACPVYLLFCVKGADGYEIHFEPFAERIRLPRRAREEGIASYAQNYADCLANYVKKYPFQWANFYQFWKDDRD